MDKVKRDGPSHTEELQVPAPRPARPAQSPAPADDRRPRPVVPFPPGAVDDGIRRTGQPGPGGLAVTSVRLSPTGQVMAGEAPEAVVESLAYAAQMADIIGELIGIEGFVWMEVARSTGPCVVARQTNGDLTSMSAGQGVDAATLKRMLGL